MGQKLLAIKPLANAANTYKGLHGYFNSLAFKYKMLKWQKRFKGFVLNIFMAIILSGIAYIILSPILGVISNAVKHRQDLVNPLIFLIPENFTLDNLRFAFTYMDFVRSLALTLVFSLGLGLVHVLIGSMVGYGFARFKIPGGSILFAVLVFTIVVPVQTYMVPLFIQFRFYNFFGRVINLVGTYTPMIMLTFTGMGLRSGLFIYIFRQFFKGMPKEIEEAAFIDGAGKFRTYITVMLPNAMPPIITVLLFAFVWHYNDIFYTSMLVTGNRMLGAMLSLLEYNFRWNELGADMVGQTAYVSLILYAGVLLLILPILIIYFLLQRHFVESIERSGIVG